MVLRMMINGVWYPWHFLVFLTIFNQLAAQTFADFIDQLTAAEEPEQIALIDSFITFTPSFPVVENDTLVHYIYRGGANSVTIPGDASNWSPDTYSMTHASGTDFWYHTQSFEADARLDYKFVISGINWILDPLNPYTCPSGFGSNSELRMPNYIPEPDINFTENIPHGVVRDTLIYSSNLSELRTVRIYTPPAYHATLESYGVIIVHDGLEYVDLALMDNVLDNLIHQQRIQPVIGIFVPPINRTAEYAGNLQDEFTAFIADELTPWIQSRYRTLPLPTNWSTLGASNGGNISLWLALDHPDIFGHVAAQSSNVQTSISSGFANENLQDMDIYLDIGTYDIPILVTLVADFVNLLTANGYSFQHTIYHEGHSWGNWRARLDEVLTQFYPAIPNYCQELYGPDSYYDDCGVCSAGTSNHEANSDIDDCGVCFGSNDCLGCTDPNADNWDPYATIDDGSCIYPQLISLQVSQPELGHLELWMNNPGPAPVWMFQFNLTGANLTSYWGGAVELYGLGPVILGVDGVVIGFNMGENTIPPDSLVLVNFTYDEALADSACINSPSISEGSGLGEINTSTGICISLAHPTIWGCMDPGAINFNPEANHDTESCLYGLRGDLDGSETLDILDIIILVDVILFTEPTWYQQAVGDMNQDGILDILDVVVLVHIILFGSQ